METLLPIVLSLVSGAIGGNLAGGLLNKLSLGIPGNSIAGMIGGVIGGNIGGQLLSTHGAGGFEVMVGLLASAGISGGVLMVILGMTRKMLAK
jgi:hypothetical protein